MVIRKGYKILEGRLAGSAHDDVAVQKMCQPCKGNMCVFLTAGNLNQLNRDSTRTKK